MPDIGPSQNDFETLTQFLRAELRGMEQKKLNIVLESERSFTEWAHEVIGKIAESLGLTYGYIEGFVVKAYDDVKTGLKRGYLKGRERGRGRKN